VWADTLLRAEQQHLLRLLVWAGLSVLAATALATILVVRRIQSPMLKQFATQTGLWGVVIGAVAAVNLRAAHLRDLAGAARLERLVWTNVGLDTGYVAVGAVLAIAAWFLVRRLSVVGAGMGIALHGLALLVLELQFAAVVSR
jgi:uncharacterized protein DUF6992